VDVAVLASWDLELEAAGSMEPQLFDVDFGPVESEEMDALETGRAAYFKRLYEFCRCVRDKGCTFQFFSLMFF